MRKIRDVLRLRAGGMSKRKIAASLSISVTAVGECVRRARRAGLIWPLPQELSDAALELRLYGRAAPPLSRRRILANRRPAQPGRDGDLPLARAKGVPQSQNFSNLSHRRSLGGHRTSPCMAAKEVSSAIRSPTSRASGRAHQGGRLRSEWVADFRRNRWPDCVGISGRFASDYASSSSPSRRNPRRDRPRRKLPGAAARKHPSRQKEIRHDRRAQLSARPGRPPARAAASAVWALRGTRRPLLLTTGTASRRA